MVIIDVVLVINFVLKACLFAKKKKSKFKKIKLKYESTISTFFLTLQSN